MKNLAGITLEISLKPFQSSDPAAIEAVCRQFFSQWLPLTKHAEVVSVLFFAADGSEILDYRGRLADTFEWAYLIGGANERRGWDKKADPHGLGLHTTHYLYTKNPVPFTYADFRTILAITRRIGREITGRPVRTGAMFDPGPEFAKSDFKYNRHPEILLGDTMGWASFVCCYGALHADAEAYAGFPQGIPEGTPFGTFFGRQCQRYLEDLGFDYIWLSNGLGFGSETWGTTGAIFDCKSFAPEKMAETQSRILEFWRLFRRECQFPVETRGTNLTAGIDLASDAVNLQAIYQGDFRLLPPPNSPWAALNGDFGLEIAGFLSRIALLPREDQFLYRFYVHDPWWVNSPWLDRYEGQPHDIYLPLAAARLDEKGAVRTADFLNLLTIDNSFGEMPDQCPNEVIPHLLKAYDQAPDALAPLVWIYPFREYSELAAGRVSKPFFEDWFIRDAINQGLPLSMVIATDNFVRINAAEPDTAAQTAGAGLFRQSILVTPVPEAGSAMNAALLRHVADGGWAMLYGSIVDADPALLAALNLTTADQALAGRLELVLNQDQTRADLLRSGNFASSLDLDPVLSDGGCEAVLADSQDRQTTVHATVSQNGQNRILALSRQLPAWQGGRLLWLRGANGGAFRGGHLLEPHDPRVSYPIARLMRQLLGTLGLEIQLAKEQPQSKDPVIMLHRHDQALFFSTYSPDTTVDIRLRFPLGAPLLMGYETAVEDDWTNYRLPRATRLECRVFVRQATRTTLSCRETAPVSFQMGRRINVTGLQDATVYYLPAAGKLDRTEILFNATYPYMTGAPGLVDREETIFGTALVVRRVTGSLMISTERDNIDDSLRTVRTE